MNDLDECLRALVPLVGSWQVTGEATGHVTYRRAEGGNFLIQDFNLVHDGRHIRGIEVIGRARGMDGSVSDDIRGPTFSFLDGLTLDYVYEMVGNKLTIWGGERGSPAFYRGLLSADGRTLEGGWQWPGGGYRTTSRLVGTRTSKRSEKRRSGNAEIHQLTRCRPSSGCLCERAGF